MENKLNMVHEDGDNKSKESKALSMFKHALADFVKNAINPTWKEGKLTKEDYKTIVKKVVDMVTSTVENIPETKEKIDIYMSSSKEKLNKLVQKCVGKSSYIPIRDNYSSYEQVTAALCEKGLKSVNPIIGIDFTKSNEWTGKRSFNGQSLHKLSDAALNPYETAIGIIGKTLAPFNEDNLIPCFGFGDTATHDQSVFSFHPDGNSPCRGFAEVLACYRKIVPHLRLSGPTSFAPIVEAAVDIVDRSRGQYHVLVIVADGQVTRSIDTSDDDLSPQERRTVDSIVMASSYPLSIVLVGVGDGPWEDMQKFRDKLPARPFDNFQFVNFTSIMSRSGTLQQKESVFALAALMDVPIQYKATMELGILGRSMGKGKRVLPAPFLLPPSKRQPSSSLRGEASRVNTAAAQPPVEPRKDQVCPTCLTNAKDLAFGCGHMCCRECAAYLTRCPICRETIRSKLRVYL